MPRKHDHPNYSPLLIFKSPLKIEVLHSLETCLSRLQEQVVKDKKFQFFPKAKVQEFWVVDSKIYFIVASYSESTSFIGTIEKLPTGDGCLVSGYLGAGALVLLLVPAILMIPILYIVLTVGFHPLAIFIVVSYLVIMGIGEFMYYSGVESRKANLTNYIHHIFV